MEKSPTMMLVVALALRDQNGLWLMHKRPPHKHHGNLWEFPGGKVETAEIPRLALVREIREELGITLDPAELQPIGFAETPARSAAQPVVILLYSARHSGGHIDSLEGGETGWFTLGQIRMLARPPLDEELTETLAARFETPSPQIYAQMG
ncbi:MAG: NUDIX domain-containing protein [Sphingomonadaceae bacterium]